ncbi:MAG: helix-turn-helix domain-containing protein [Thermomicrobiales bacterium]|nr:helix-turn-helix domain-containing protein [Thermomicrobiales bacterium]
MAPIEHIPFINAFQETSSLSVRAEVSLHAEVSNHLIMVDYAAVDAPSPTPWAWDVWSRFTEQERSLLKDLHCVLIHGLMLQEYWFKRAVPVSTWDELLLSVEVIGDTDLERLVAESMVSGIQYYRQEMTPQSRIDDLLPDTPDDLTANGLLADPDLFYSVAAANHLSWGVPEDHLNEVLEMVLHPGALRQAVYRLLEALRKHGSEEACLNTDSKHSSWLQNAVTMMRSMAWHDASSAIEDLTGRRPPTVEAQRVNLETARDLVLIPCSHLGSSQRITTIGSHHIVMFEPSLSIKAGLATDQPTLSEAVSLLRAITESPAFSLVQSLASGDEKYALQLADDAQVHQSTVSRHLAMLERAGAVEVRPEGKAKYYRLNSSRIRKALTIVGQALTADAE